MSDDTSVTVAAAITIFKLVDRVQRYADPDDSRELARRNAEALKHLDRRVGAALAPRKRGGVMEWQADQIAERADGYRKLAMAEYGTTLLTPRQAGKLNRKLKRILDDARSMEGAGSIQQEAMRQIRTAGGAVSDRHVLRILPRKKL
jgi:hypothetical protein